MQVLERIRAISKTEIETSDISEHQDHRTRAGPPSGDARKPLISSM